MTTTIDGATDYFEPMGLISSGPTGLSFGAGLSGFSGFLARAA